MKIINQFYLSSEDIKEIAKSYSSIKTDKIIKWFGTITYIVLFVLGGLVLSEKIPFKQFYWVFLPFGLLTLIFIDRFILYFGVTGVLNEGRCLIVLTEDTIEDEQEKHGWLDIVEIKGDNKYIYIVFRDGGFVPLKREVLSKEDTDAFLKLLDNLEVNVDANNNGSK